MTDQDFAAVSGIVGPGPPGEPVDAWMSLEALHRPLSNERPLLVYRGSMQRNRVRILLNALQSKYGEVDMVWLIPRVANRSALRWLVSQSSLTGLRLEDGRRGRLVGAGAKLAMDRYGPRPTVVALNFLTVLSARRVESRFLAWFVQSAPEDRYYHQRGWRARFFVEAQWWLAGRGRKPDVTVAVSSPLAGMIQSRLGLDRVVHVPNSVVDEAFDGNHPPLVEDPLTLAYVGSGAPWQGIDDLKQMWVAMSRANPELRFRIVSKDPRSKQLADALPDAVAEVLEVQSAAEVVAALRGCAAGFILRRESVASAASWPVKLGEYLAASVPVVAFRWPWDVAEVIEREACGLLLDPAGTNHQHAETILAWLGSSEHRDAVDRSSSVAADWSDQNVSKRILDLLPAS